MPRLQFSVMEADTVLVEWTEPFTWAQYPITSYSLTIKNATETEDSASLAKVPLFSVELSPSTHFYAITSSMVPACTNLTFSLKAINMIGTSLAGIIYIALPDSKFCSCSINW